MLKSPFCIENTLVSSPNADTYFLVFYRKWKIENKKKNYRGPREIKPITEVIQKKTSTPEMCFLVHKHTYKKLFKGIL